MLDRIKVSSADVQRLSSSIVAYLNGTIPDANFSDGTALHDLVVVPIATVIAALEGDVNQLESRLAIQKLLEDETESAASMLDQLASNFFISRNTGSRSEGVVQITLSSNDAFTLPIGTLFEKSPGVEFVYDQEQPLVVASTDMEPETNSDGSFTGNYVANVFVTASRDGIGSGLIPGKFTSMTNSPKNLISITNKDTFTEVDEQESNFEFASRLKDALTYRGFNTERSIRTVLLDSIDSVINVYVVGAGDPAMQRDVLNIGTHNKIHTLGKINVIADTGFSIVSTDVTSAEEYSFSALQIEDNTGTKIPARYELDGRVFYGDKSVDDLPASNEYRQDIEAKYWTLDYSDPNFARTLIQDATLTCTEANALARLYSPRSTLAVETYISNEGVAPLGVDLQVYYPALKLLSIKISYTKNPELPSDQFPESFIQSSISRYIKSSQSARGYFSVADLYGYIGSTFSTFISSIDFGGSSVGYSLLLPDGSNVHYECNSDTSVEKSTSYYFNYKIINGEVGYEVVRNHVTVEYLNSLQISDEYCVLYCDPKEITLEEV
jgi:hypothetical protein